MTTKMGMRRMALKVQIVAIAAGFTAVLAATAAMAQSSGIATHTSLTTETVQVSGRAVSTYTATVLNEDGTPATGSVTLVEGAKALASAALDSTGKAAIRYDSLSAANHSLRAVYSGDTTHEASTSLSLAVHPEATTPSFSLGIAVSGSTDASTMTIAAPGDSGSLVATVTPANGFTGFVTFSCSGDVGGTSLPVGVSCTFTPSSVQVLAPTTTNTTGAQTSDMSLVTTANNGSTSKVERPNHRHGLSSSDGPLFLAILFPAAAIAGYLGRKRKLLQGIAALALVGTLSTMCLTGCAARYKYLHHGPTTEGTPAGTYTITITAQTSNGLTASSQSQTMTLIVK